jgi:hypothetical protein
VPRPRRRNGLSRAEAQARPAVQRCGTKKSSASDVATAPPCAAVRSTPAHRRAHSPGLYSQVSAGARLPPCSAPPNSSSVPASVSAPAAPTRGGGCEPKAVEMAAPCGARAASVERVLRTRAMSQASAVTHVCQAGRLIAAAAKRTTLQARGARRACHSRAQRAAADPRLSDARLSA